MKQEAWIVVRASKEGIKTNAFDKKEKAESYKDLLEKGERRIPEGEMIDIQRIEVEVDISKAHREKVVNFMESTLREDFELEDTDDFCVRDLAEEAYDKYCEGNGFTEYECVEAVYDEYLERERQEREE